MTAAASRGRAMSDSDVSRAQPRSFRAEGLARRDGHIRRRDFPAAAARKAVASRPEKGQDGAGRGFGPSTREGRSRSAP